MPRIEWQDTVEFEPPRLSMQGFCQGIGVRSAFTDRGTVVFVEKRALEELHEFLASDVSREHGGVLVGRPFYDPEEQRYFVNIQSAVPARGSGGTPVHLQFTREAWSHISGTMRDRCGDQIVVGWYHSHPGLGVFMSSTDRATQEAFYNHPWNLAVVVDPVAQKTGWFADADCRLMDRDAVVPYEEPRSAAREESKGYRPKQVAWLLPSIGIVLAIVVAATWFLGKARPDAEAEQR